MASTLDTAWSRVPGPDQVFLAKMTAPTVGGGYSVYLTDLGRVWACRMEGSDIAEMCKMLNPDVDAPVKTILQHLHVALSEPDKVNAHFRIEDGDVCELTMTSQLAGFSFGWNFMFEKASPDVMRHHLTLPLTMMVSELRRQQTELMKIIRAKDAEIENYHIRGLKVTRKNLETEKFDAESFPKTMRKTQEFQMEAGRLGRGIISAVNQNLYSDLMNAIPDTVDAGKLVASTWADAKPSTSPESPSKVARSKAAPVKEPVEEPKDAEINRKRALADKLAKEEQKLVESKKKKKKLKL